MALEKKRKYYKKNKKKEQIYRYNLRRLKQMLETMETQEVEKYFMLCRQTFSENSPKALKKLAI